MDEILKELLNDINCYFQPRINLKDKTSEEYELCTRIQKILYNQN